MLRFKTKPFKHQLEKWKIIKDFPEYEISSHGRLRRRLPGRGAITGRILKPRRDEKGYLMFGLSKNNKVHNRRVARLILETFIGPRPIGLETCHSDGNKNNNHLSNLRWDSHTNNMRDRIRHGRIWNHSFKDNELNLILKLRKTGMSYAKIARTINRAKSTVRYCLKRRFGL